MIKIGISIGDINGIGLEVILKTLADTRLLDRCIPVIYASSKTVSYHRNIIQAQDLAFQGVRQATQLKEGTIYIVNCWQENVSITLGKVNEIGGKYASLSLNAATADLQEGLIDALITAPIHKKAMQLSGFEFTGHTEYLTQRFNARASMMMMLGEQIRVGFVTNHLALGKVAEAINQEKIVQKLQILNDALRIDFGIDRPRIAVLGLNPHASDEGLIGAEEQEIIIPALQEAKTFDILAIGPYSPDAYFGSLQYRNFDATLAMYHDQGMIPFKLLSFGQGVNYTAGLSVVRTSPDHGTAYDIAGRNMANPSSFRKALFQTIDIVHQRAQYASMTDDPLKRGEQAEMFEMEDDFIEEENNQ